MFREQAERDVTNHMSGGEPNHLTPETDSPNPGLASLH